MQIKFKQPTNTTNRIETGLISFNDNCKGIFIRGDNYAYLNMCLYMFDSQKLYRSGDVDEYPNKLLNMSETQIKKIVNLLKDDNYNQIQNIDDEITVEIINGITHINGYNGTFSNANSMSFGTDWDGEFIEKSVCIEIYDILSNLKVTLKDHQFYYVYFTNIYSVFKHSPNL